MKFEWGEKPSEEEGDPKVTEASVLMVPVVNETRALRFDFLVIGESVGGGEREITGEVVELSGIFFRLKMTDG